jgi:hypothetical protein
VAIRKARARGVIYLLPSPVYTFLGEKLPPEVCKRTRLRAKQKGKNLVLEGSI